MKLLMITGLGSAMDLASGKKGAFYNTLEEFHQYWERIDIISPKIKRQKSETKEIFGNVYVHISPWPLLFHPIWFLKKGLEIFREQKFDLMTVQEFPPFYNGIGARLLWQKIKVPYVLEIFHVPGYPKFSNTKEFIYRTLVRAFISYDTSHAKAVRIMNNDVGKFLELSGVPKNKLSLIPAIYIDLDIFKPADIQKEYDLIFIGRLEANKGIELFLETVKKLDCKAIIVGQGSLYNKTKSEVEGQKLNIVMYGFAKDSKEIAELLNKSKILVMPSYNEGGPRVLVEAMACGVPVLATPVGIVPDLLKNGSGGEIIAWNAEDVANKAKGLLNNFERYNKLSAMAIEIAKSFEKKSAIKNYADKLKALI